MVKLSLKHMIFAGFGSVLLLLAILAGMALRGTSVIGHDFTEYRQAAREALLFNQANGALLDARVGVSRFMIDHQMEQVTAVRDALDRLGGIKADAEQLLDDPSRIEQLDALRGEAARFRDAFEQVVTTYESKAALLPVIAESGRAARSAISEIMSDAAQANDVEAAYRAGVLQQHIMLARLYAERFLGSNDPAFKMRVDEETALASQASAALLRTLQTPSRRALHGAFETQFATFTEQFGAAAALLSEMNAIKAEQVDAIGPQLAAGYGALADDAVGTQNVVGPQAAAEVATVTRNTVMLAIVALVVGAAAAFFIGQLMSRAIGGVVARMNALAQGDLEIDIAGTERKDELGAMARALVIFKDNGIERQRLEDEQAQQAEIAAAKKTREMNELADGFEMSVNEVVSAVSSAAEQMVGLSQGMSDAADRANGRSSTVAAASEEASTNVETVAAASEEMTNSIAEVSERISQSATMTDDAARGAERATQTVSQLSTSAQTIGEVVKLISDIAEQTNLLALNATIEAARAGEAGKGFAVVASEVKSLANQTAKATEQISAQVTGMQGDTNAVVDAIDQIGTMIQDLNSTASSIAAAVEEQHSATQEIARNTQQAADGTREVSSNITEVSTAVMETGQAAREVLSASSQLAEQSEQLQGRVADFLTKIRAA
ncbi:MAG: HAMP domain-containing protein [Devosiaceae bacterium]|nr:HAMP domain-containing protein [Devosiaceae bacterium MH13]